jgi:AraC family transcriptional regulator of adaptative response/methylated-DNA-[protein]-cysteine methyltransferase
LVVHTVAEETYLEAVRRRDRAADGSFVYAVATTGVYCRPSCAARPARPENISFFATPLAAERAGFRACKRCRPDRFGEDPPDVAAVRRACAAIEAAEEAPSLDALAAQAGLSRFHFHRVFKAVTGVTPRAFARAEREKRLHAALRGGGTVTEALYAAGYGSASRLYESAAARLGMTPGALKRGGAGETIDFAVVPTSLGQLLVAATEAGICAITLGDDAEALEDGLRARFPSAQLRQGAQAFALLVARAAALVERPDDGMDLPLDIRGTSFQQRVWAELRRIKAGETISYTELARRLGQPNAARAVASACARNGLAVAIPCHRVLRENGALGGYRWGLQRKQALLDREREGSGK